jgi:flavin-dependent dehydrogenase
MYDVIVVGTRVAGASTAMLLARHGLKVLAVDRARFPSDTVSTHQIQVPGVARLQRWGLLDGVIAAGTPPVRRVRFDPGPVVLRGRLPIVDGADAIYSPRRTVLDALLVDAARAAGAEVRERFVVEDLVTADDRVIGVRGRTDGGATVQERARLVVGADGRHSLVARRVDPPIDREAPPCSVAVYTYWSGVRVDGVAPCTCGACGCTFNASSRLCPSVRPAA